MLSDDTISKISRIFCGDTEEYYSYKSGPQLVRFFNENFNRHDQYGQGFPSRWIYVYNIIVELINSNSFDVFISIILSKEYLVHDCDLTQVQAAERSQVIFEELNRLVQRDQCAIISSNGEYHLIMQRNDLILIGSGGFANVYRQKSTGIVVKKLKDDFLTDRSIRSRFKREFDITKSLEDVYGIINVYSFDASSCSYTMEPAEQTLEEYLSGSSITHEIRVNCIRQILYIMTIVHERDIIHRDLSPNNIFIISGSLKIADFGLGKDLNVLTSHQTITTNAVGQYYYCAPEQFMLLREADKRSDVYSLGRMINFIMTGDPVNSNHVFRSVSEKATNSDSVYRYADAKQLNMFFERSVQYHQNAEHEAAIWAKIANMQFDDDVEAYIYELSSEKICRLILDSKDGFSHVLIQFMKCDNNHAMHIIQSIDSSFRETCGRSFAANDPFATFAYLVLKDNFPFVVKEIAASVLRYIASDVNRFSAQHMVEELLKTGIEPLLEDILIS